VLRGGSYINNHRNVRCSARNRNNPNNMNDNIGFRVALSTFFTLAFSRGWFGFGSEAKNGGAYSWPYSETSGSGK
jgi:hypothetical protein